MAVASNRIKQSAPLEAVVPPRPVLGEFYSFEVLWLSSTFPPIFSSEGAARWFMRNHRARLAEAKATAIHTGRVLVHPARFAAVAESIALQLAADRAGVSS